MAATPQHGTQIIAGINVTPLVDITLVLLIVFIVTAKLIVTPAIPLELPRASQTDAVQVVFAISLAATGSTFVNGRSVANDQALIQLASDALSQDSALRAIISADGAVPHRRVIHVLDLLKSAGIARVGFGALPPEPATK